MVRINFADVEEFTKLAPGPYVFAITDHEVKHTKDTSKYPDSEYWRLELTVQEGDKTGTKEWLNLFLPPYSAAALKSLLRATIGQHEWSEDDVESGDFDIDAEDLHNLTFAATIAPQKGNADFNDVKKIKSVSEFESSSDDMLP